MESTCMVYCNLYIVESVELVNLWTSQINEAIEVIQATEDSLLQTYIFLLQKSILGIRGEN